MNCNNCGACCEEQESPPGYLLCLDRNYKPTTSDAKFDLETFQIMPEEARESIRLYAHALRNGLLDPDDSACIWLDENKRCRWYEWRPSICRMFRVGCDSCHEWRRKYEIAPDTEQAGG